MQKLCLILISLLCSSLNPEAQGPRVTPLTYNFIRHQEKLVLVAYPDPASQRARYRQLTGVDDPALDGAPWTVGFGCTGPNIVEGTCWTRRRAHQAFEHRVDRLGEALQASLATEISQAQFDALISFAFNLGSGVLKPGSRLMTLINGRNFDGAARFMRGHTKASGQHYPGLVTRRALEITLFNQ